jgi:hypothetical protein
MVGGSGWSEQRAPDARLARLEARWWRFREPRAGHRALPDEVQGERKDRPRQRDCASRKRCHFEIETITLRRFFPPRLERRSRWSMVDGRRRACAAADGRRRADCRSRARATSGAKHAWPRPFWWVHGGYRFSRHEVVRWVRCEKLLILLVILVVMQRGWNVRASRAGGGAVHSITSGPIAVRVTDCIGDRSMALGPARSPAAERGVLLLPHTPKRCERVSARKKAFRRT